MDILRELKKKIADIDAQILAMEGRSPTFTVSEIMDLIDSVESAQEISCSEIPNSSDTISKQAAIRWVKIECNPYGKPTLDFESGKKVIKHLEQMPSAQPEQHYDEWCTDCKEYDHERHCCPRWNRVIRETLKDTQPERGYIEIQSIEGAYSYWENQNGDWSDIDDVVVLMPLPESWKEEK